MRFRRRRRTRLPQPAGSRTAGLPAVPVPLQDPLHAVLLQTRDALDVDALELASPALAELRDAGARLVIPLVGNDRLLGTLALGPRLSEEPYSSEDRRMLARLAGHVAPAIRVANLLQERQAAAQRRERLDHELRVAALIQQTLLPRQLPSPDGWEIDAHYRPAREVGGDFYDFLPLEDGRLIFMIGDVTDKGIPAALVMATTRAHLRAAAQRHVSPGAVLAHVNELLVAEIPDGMFVTCLYGVLDPVTGAVCFANAGHVLPLVRGRDRVEAVRARGMPLGLLPGMEYEERTTTVAAGASLILSSDGIAESHAADGTMYGLPRTEAALRAAPDDDLIGYALADLDRFTGYTPDPEDDLTLVTLRHLAASPTRPSVPDGGELVAAFSVAAAPGNEREVMDRVADAVLDAGLSSERLARLKTAVAEAAMNAIEHGNGGDPSLQVDVDVLRGPTDEIRVRVRDRGQAALPEHPEQPDLDAKLNGEQSPRGWGLFLIRQMVDDLHVRNDVDGSTVELIMTTRTEEPA